MFKNYLKQTFFLLKENKLISCISITGTALAIAMIMVVIIVVQTQYASFPPETKRDRMLISKFIAIKSLENEGIYASGSISYKIARECFKALTIPEAVSVISLEGDRLVSKPAGDKDTYPIRECDDEYWKIFNFSFLKGQPFSKADFEAGFTKVVISEKIALSLYGTIDVIGETLLLDYVPYTICGVVKNVSPLAEYAYAQLWIPFTSTNIIEEVWGMNELMGSFHVLILAHSKNDLDSIREEVETLRKKYSISLRDLELVYFGQPDTYFVSKQRTLSSDYPDTKGIIRLYVFSLLVLLIVPAVNLSGITLSRMQKRISEIGIRKAFGATKKEIMIQVLSENFLYTLIGGVLGLMLSYLACFILTEMLFSTDMNNFDTITPAILFNPVVFVLAFLFCLLLNILSALIPAWRVTRVNIVDSLYER